MNEWLRVHPYKYNPDASLWVSKDKIPPKRGSKERIYKPLTEDMVQRFVHKAVIKAGIKKRVHPHLFRHTCATELAKDWTEPMLRAFLGWERNSNMPSVYTHLSGQDIEAAQRKRLGMAKSIEPREKVPNLPEMQKWDASTSRILFGLL